METVRAPAKDIVDNHHQRSIAAQQSEQLFQGSERLAADSEWLAGLLPRWSLANGQRPQGLKHGSDGIPKLRAQHAHDELRRRGFELAAQLLEHAIHRLVGNPLAFVAAARQNQRLRSDEVQQLAEQRALADAGLAMDADHGGLSRGAHGGERFP